MKKLFALMLALCLVLCCTAVQAEDTMSGNYVALEKLGMQIFIFDSMVEDTEAQASEGTDLLYAWKAADGAEDRFVIEAADLSEQGITTPEAFLAAINDSGKADSAQIVTLENGLQVVLVTSSADNEICASIVYDNGVVVGFTISPIAGQEDAASALLGYLMGSLTPIQAE